MSYVNTSNAGDGFDLDTILSILATLTWLKLSGSTLQLAAKEKVSLQQRHHQTSPDIHQTTRTDLSTSIMDYLSQCCPDLKRLIMYDCQQQQQQHSRDNHKLKSV